MSVSRSRDLEVMEGEWECMECGYIEEGPSNRRPKKCPECNASGSEFEFFEYEDEDESWDDDWDDDLDEEWEDEDLDDDDD